MVKGDTVFSIGAAIVVGSLAGYVGASIFGLVRFFLGLFVGPDAFAVMLVGIFLGLLLLAIGWVMGEFEKGKGT